VISRPSPLVFAAALLILTGGLGFAAEAAAEAKAPAKDGLAIGLIALGAAIAIGATAIATGIAQSRIGAAGAGTIAERPESSGTIIVLLAIPETMVILGFIVAVIILFTL